ncbi:MAG: DUF4177 domain-containing protein [Bacteroidia bacterium]|nr:DUF4177 domain-containing protein [Bacteroidia bacterium]
MVKYEYKVVNVAISQWTSRAKSDYLKIINDYGAQGWRFLQFAPPKVRPRGVKGIDLIFERVVPAEE